MIARIYVRFSPRPRPEETETLEFQEEECRRWCAKHGHEPSSVYADPDISGRKESEEDRPELWRAMDALQRGEMLLAWKWERLSRSVYLSEVLCREAKAKGAVIATVMRGVDSSDPDGVLIRQVLSAFDEYTAKVIAVRTKHAMRRFQRHNVAMSKVAPFGKREGPARTKLKDGREVVQRTWEESPEEAAVVERIIRMKSDGATDYSIAKLLNDEGVAARGRKWYVETVRRIVERAKLEA